jgi:WD40-like Beta Propeller Repeat
MAPIFERSQMIIFGIDRLTGRQMVTKSFSTPAEAEDMKSGTFARMEVGYNSNQTRLAVTGDLHGFILKISNSMRVETVEKLPSIGNAGEALEPTSWSPDGKWLAGGAFRPDGSYLNGVYIYSFESGKFEKLPNPSNDPPAQLGPTWLKDSRRLLCVSSGKIFLVDRISKEHSQIYSSPSNNSVGQLEISKDNKTIYYNRIITEGDIWLMTMK